jgi:polyisoprenoid-binding protein YceI
VSTLTETRSQLAPGTWDVDAAHSQIGFALPYMTGTFRGSFSPFEATLKVEDDGAATLTGVARVESVKVQDENLSAHLQSPDFFDAERTPEIRFEANGIERDGEEIVAKGELTIRGVTKPVELRGTVTDPIVDAYSRERIGLNLETEVDRTEFGLNWNMPLTTGEPALPNDVKLNAELYFVKA